MGRWSDAKTTKDRGLAVQAALAEAGTVTGAAILLGVSRRHLTRLLGRTSETRCLTETGETGAASRTLKLVSGRETLPNESLSTHGRRVPTFGFVSTVATMAEETVRVAFDIPKSCLDWLETEALRRKQREGGRMAKSPIVVELIEQAKAKADAAEPAE